MYCFCSTFILLLSNGFHKLTSSTHKMQLNKLVVVLIILQFIKDFRYIFCGSISNQRYTEHFLPIRHLFWITEHILRYFNCITHFEFNKLISGIAFSKYFISSVFCPSEAFPQHLYHR